MGSKLKLRKGDPLARCFLPNGRTAPIIYAVRLREQPHLIKVGKTKRWASRRTAYDNWNLALGDGVEEFRTYTFIEEYVDLDMIERHVLAAMPFPIGYGREWFATTFEEATQALDRIIEDLGLSYM